jgi:hypothetical protein
LPFITLTIEHPTEAELTEAAELQAGSEDYIGGPGLRAYATIDSDYVVYA